MWKLAIIRAVCLTIVLPHTIDKPTAFGFPIELEFRKSNVSFCRGS